MCTSSKTPISITVTPVFGRTGILGWNLWDLLPVCTHIIYYHTFNVTASKALIREDEVRLGGRLNVDVQWDYACNQVDGGLWGYLVDDCPPFVFQIRGNLLAIVVRCLFTSQRAERRDFTSTEPLTSRFFFFFFSLFHNRPLWVFLLLFYPRCPPPPRFVRNALHSQPRPAIV